MRRFNPEKELYRIQHGNRNKIFIGAFLILLIISISSTYALYQVQYSKRIIYTKVAPFSNHDLDLAIYVDGSKVDKLPEKGEGYYYESITCESDSNAIAGWDYTNWKLGAISVTVPNKCNLNFTSHSTTLIDQIKYVNGNNPELVKEDETMDHNLRYIGASPDNYIWFNCNNYDGLTFLNAEDNEHKCEKWRIIGLFNKIIKSSNDEDTLVKIIRADKIGNIAWDKNSYNWMPSSLMTGLNDPYLNNSDSGDWITQEKYTGKFETNTKDVSYKGITSPTRTMIEEVKWYVGAINDGSVGEFYINEKTSATWLAKIALIYPSDYGYATSGSELSDDLITNRDGCLAHNLGSWGNNPYQTNCAYNSWLLDTSTTQWLLTSKSFGSSSVFDLDTVGNVGSNLYYANAAYAIRPTLYLKSNIGVAGGNGSEETPYILVP